MEKTQFPTRNELAKIIRRSLKGKIPEEDISIYMFQKFESGKAQFPTMNELSKIIRRSLKGKIPEENISIFMSQNFESGAVCFNLQVSYPTVESLCPERVTTVVKTVSCPVLDAK